MKLMRVIHNQMLKHSFAIRSSMVPEKRRTFDPYWMNSFSRARSSCWDPKISKRPSSKKASHHWINTSREESSSLMIDVRCPHSSEQFNRFDSMQFAVRSHKRLVSHCLSVCGVVWLHRDLASNIYYVLPHGI